MTRWKKIGVHLLYWVFASLFLWLFLKSRSPEQLQTVGFLSLLMPVTIGTSYVINYYLLGKLLLRHRYLQFFVYGLFTIAACLYLQAILMTVYFAWLAKYSFENLGPVAGNIVYLGTSTFAVIFLSAVIYLFRRNMVAGSNADLQESNPIETKADTPQPIRIVSNRKSHLLMPDDILYIESLGNYIKIHALEDTLVSKEKISNLEERLPEQFIRIHRSFVVNRLHVQSFGKESMTVKGQQLNISRTYKKAVAEALTIPHSSTLQG